MSSALLALDVRHLTTQFAVGALPSSSDRNWFVLKYLLIVIAFLALLYFGSKYLVRRAGCTSTDNLKVVGVARLGADSFVYMLEACGKRYLVAQNKHAITLLDVLDDKSFGQTLEDKKEAIEVCNQTEDLASEDREGAKIDE